MIRNQSKIVPKMMENTRTSSLGAVLEHFWDLLGAEMVQDASREASGAPCGGLLGRILTPRWASWGQGGAKMAPIHESTAVMGLET